MLTCLSEQVLCSPLCHCVCLCLCVCRHVRETWNWSQSFGAAPTPPVIRLMQHRSLIGLVLLEMFVGLLLWDLCYCDSVFWEHWGVTSVSDGRFISLYSYLINITTRIPHHHHPSCAVSCLFPTQSGNPAGRHSFRTFYSKGSLVSGRGGIHWDELVGQL